MKSHRIWSESGETGLRLKKKKRHSCENTSYLTSSYVSKLVLNITVTSTSNFPFKMVWFEFYATCKPEF